MKHEALAQEIYEQEDILCELSPYILTGEEALKLHPIYYDLVEHYFIIYDPDGLIAHYQFDQKNLIPVGSTESAAEQYVGMQLINIGYPGGVNL